MKKTKIAFLVLASLLLVGCGNKKEETKPVVETKKPVIKTEKAQNDNQVEQNNPIKDIKAKIVSVDVGQVKILEANGKEKVLYVPQKDASFMKKTQSVEGEELMMEIGLFDLPKDKDLDIRYNDQTKEVMLIVVSE